MEPNFAHAWLHGDFVFDLILSMKMFLWNGLIQKKSKQGGWGYGIYSRIKEATCGISRGLSFWP